MIIQPPKIRQDLFDLQKLINEHPEFIRNLDTFITVQLMVFYNLYINKVLPSDELVKVIPKNIFRTKDRTPL